MANGVAVRQLGQLAAAMTRMKDNFYQPPTKSIQGVDPSNWPSALQPVRPVGPEGSQPIGFPFMMGQNLMFTPRSGEVYSAADLQTLATYPLARICIENIKDQIVQIGWSIREKQYPRRTFQRYRDRKSRSMDPVSLKVSRFLEYPDGEHSWDVWLRPILDDLLTIDAPSILVRKRGNGHVGELRYVPGASITRYIDDNGFTPQPPSPAYAQLWNGVPRVNMTSDQLIYRPRNIVPREGNAASYLYGMSPVEQIADEIKVGVMRLAFVQRFYDKGSLPNVIHVVPPDTPVDKIKEGMQWMNSELAGNLSNRRQWRMVQGFKTDGKDDQIIFPSEPVLADIFDDLHIRKICFAFGTSPQRLQRPMNRGCHSEDTDVLTGRGWVKFPELSDDDTVASFDGKSGRIKLTKPSKVYRYQYSGEMIHFKTRNVDVLVTPEHKMWCRKFNSRSKKFSEFEKFEANNHPFGMKFVASVTPGWSGNYPRWFTLPVEERVSHKVTSEDVEYIKSETRGWPATPAKSIKDVASELGVHTVTVYNVLNDRFCSRKPTAIEIPPIPMNDWLEFLGYYISEGGLASSGKGAYKMTIGQSERANPETTSRMAACLGRMPFTTNECSPQGDGMRRWNIYGKPLWNYLRENVGTYSFNKRIPREFLEMPIDQLRILFRSMMEGDGSWDSRGNRNSGSYSTTSKQLADDFQELALKLGYSTSIRVNPRDESRHEQFIVCLCNRKEHFITSRSVGRQDYDGVVYCVEVPTGLFITRRNGKVAIHSNSAAQAQEAAIEEGMKPWVCWLKGMMDYIVQRVMGCSHHEWSPDALVEIDELKQTKCDASDFANGISTINDILVSRGLDEDPDPMCSKRGIRTTSGFIPFSETIKILQAQARKQPPETNDEGRQEDSVREAGEGRRKDPHGVRSGDGGDPGQVERS